MNKETLIKLFQEGGINEDINWATLLVFLAIKGIKLGVSPSHSSERTIELSFIKNN